jgi:xanthine dehydrogenase iron-sulfur cluster and FAD-binding subunit A
MTDLRASASYRITTAANLLWRLWLECRDGDPLAPRLTQVRPALEADA